MRERGCQRTAGLPQRPQQTLRMHRMHRRKVCFTKGQQQRALVNVQQVFVGRDQERDLLKRRFSQDQTVVKLVFGNEALMDQPSDELFAASLCCGVEIKGPNAPLRQTGQSNACNLPFRFTLALCQNGVQLVGSCRRQNECVALPLESLEKIVSEILLRSKIEDEISVEGELLLWPRHKSSPLPR